MRCSASRCFCDQCLRRLGCKRVATFAGKHSRPIRNTTDFAPSCRRYEKGGDGNAASASLRTADDYRAEAREFDKLARTTRDPQLKKHYADLAHAFRELAKAQ